MKAWIDYIIAGNEPADRALIREYNVGTWSHAQLLRWISVDPARITTELFTRMEGEQKLADALQKRIHQRGAELQAAGAQPANEGQIAAWEAMWRPLAQNIPVEDDRAEFTEGLLPKGQLRAPSASQPCRGDDYLGMPQVIKLLYVPPDFDG